MNKKMMIGSGALVAVVVTGLTSVAMADRMARGPDGPFRHFDFTAIDADGDGKITRAEVEAERAARVASADADKDGRLSAAELKAQHMEQAGSRADEMVARMIERHDSDGDGQISVAELAAGPSQMPLFDRIDADKDGAVSLAEIDAARERMSKRKGRHHGGSADGPQD